MSGNDSGSLKAKKPSGRGCLLLLVSLQEAMLLLKADEGKMQSPLEVQGVISGSLVQCFCTGDKMDLGCMGCEGVTNKQGEEQRETE